MKIGVVTATRAEYGLLKPLIKKINDDPDAELVLIVTGTHLVKEYGNTVTFIEEDGVPITEKVHIDIDTLSNKGISETMGRYFFAFADVFERRNMDFLIVLGDRYELIPICFSALNAKIPIGHISGGEITEGAIDDAVRHCITKMSFLHFPACETYRKRIIQLGESPDRVFNVGDPGVENVRSMELLSREEIYDRIELQRYRPYFVVTYHPVTLDTMEPDRQVEHLLDAIKKYKEFSFVFIKSNADMGGMMINNIIEKFVTKNDNCVLVSSLRVEEFLSLQKYSIGVIGNSSSGIVETPCFGIPTINIGDRQKGRLMADSIISCSIDSKEIEEAIQKACSSEFKEKARKTVNPYGSGDTSDTILKIVKEWILGGINIKKRFFDIVEK